MSNHALGQTAWNKLMRRIGFMLGVIKRLRDQERFFDASRGRTQIREENDTLASTSLWTLSGVQIGTNTDDDGVLYVRITDGSPNTVDLYKAAGGSGGDKVATGTGSDGATVTLSASNSSGLTGTVKLATIGASETSDLHRLRVYPDLAVRARVLFDGTEQEDGAILASALDASERSKALVAASIAYWQTALTTFLQTEWARIMKSATRTTSAISRATLSDNGTISTVFTGLLEDGRANMADETSPAAQTVLARTVTPASATYHASNQGKGALLATPTMEEWARAGLVRMTCVSATIGQELFELTQVETATAKSFTALNKLRINKVFADPQLGIRTMKLLRTWAFTGATADFNTTQSNWSLTGETSTNTNDGVIYLKVTGSTGAWIVSGYSSSTYSTASKVFASEAGAAAATVNFSESNGSGLSGYLKIGTAPTTGNTGALNLQTWRTQRSADGKPDEITFDVAVTRGGEFQERVAELFGYALNSTASSPTISDSYVSACTFPAYEVVDA